MPNFGAGTTELSDYSCCSTKEEDSVMSQPRTLTVNQNEISARADEVESPIPKPPSSAAS
ncbi:hypothetical protein I545_1871 [Mycobacterium kansasii 662]|uniref:Uncharacterized protein n=2 Tax=Mycobacterium kansasii TaxID=1768 RepID=A0A1V3XMX3_MYCKA|nr:hypothetical protein I547_3656 [Mycobacterium kansasii 824]EUA20344.1 hypothetical protein I545_1871 [Mycobacterium kansasii 662]OOK78829.1 hypothetical protein BZL30_2495 [Mycobacterium kansasii]OOK80577.1 hypothetical protein BZL29_2468 [Mycobacterium kansasii]